MDLTRGFLFLRNDSDCGSGSEGRTRRLIKWLTIGLAVLVVIAISVAIAYPLTKRPLPMRFEVPTTLVIDDKRAHLVFGEGESNMVTEAIIEVSNVVTVSPFT